MKKILIVFGTRPEIIKLSPVIKELKKSKIEFDMFFTKQHFIPRMSWDFIKSMGVLELKKPITLRGKFSWDACLKQCSNIVVNYDAIIVQGDTFSGFLGALAGKWNRKKVIHIEAGIRSKDPNMLEEGNRMMIDQISDILFVPCKIHLPNLDKSYGKKYVVGNTITDVLDSSKRKLKTKPHNKTYIYLTIHRPELVDNKKLLKGALKSVGIITKTLGNPVIILPLHPRAKSKIKKFGLDIKTLMPTVKIINPINLEESLNFIKYARLVITDSGGIQEESCILKTPCLTLRNNTERPETIKIKSNFLLGTDSDKIINNFSKVKFAKKWIHPYGKQVSKKIVGIIKKEMADW